MRQSSKTLALAARTVCVVGSWWWLSAALLACSSDPDPQNSRDDSDRGTGAAASGAAAASGGALAGTGQIDNPMPGQSVFFEEMMGAPEPCASKRITVSRVIPTVMLLVDGSQSMQEQYGTAPVDADASVPDGGMATGAAISRWAAVRDALANPNTGVVASLQRAVYFGLAVYGTLPSCPLPLGVVDPKLSNYVNINLGLPFGPPGLFTPSGVALDQIVDRLPDPTLVAPDGAVIGPQIIVFATDGDPNDCMAAGGLLAVPMTNYAPSIAAAQKAAAKHLKMYVISVGRDAGAQHLQEMANIGAGLDQFASPGATVYYPENPAVLSDTLRTLIGDELSCDLTLEGKGVMTGLECMGTVTLNGEPLECNGANGWVLTNSTTITLQGTTCEMFKSSVDTTIEAEFPCELIIPE